MNFVVKLSMYLFPETPKISLALSNSTLFPFLCLPCLRKNLSMSDLRFVQSYQNRKKGIEEKFFEAEAKK